MDINIKDLTTRNLVNHFVIGYFALYVILGDDFIKFKLLKQIVLAIVASYLLFIPARFIVRHHWGEWEENKKAYTYYHFRIFTVLLFLTLIKLLSDTTNFLGTIIDRLPCSLPDQWGKIAIVFIVVAIADLLTWHFYRKDNTDC